MATKVERKKLQRAYVTFQELKEILNSMNENDLECTATICDVDRDEYHPIVFVDKITHENDSLEMNHPFIAF